MNELIEIKNGKPVLRVSSDKKTNITLDTPNKIEFDVVEAEFSIIATKRKLTRITLEKKVGSDFVVIKEWFANRQPYLFKNESGKYRVTASQSSAQIIIRGE